MVLFEEAKQTDDRDIFDIDQDDGRFEIAFSGIPNIVVAELRSLLDETELDKTQIAISYGFDESVPPKIEIKGWKSALLKSAVGVIYLGP